MPGVLAGLLIAIGLIVAAAYEGVEPWRVLGGLGTVALVIGAVWLAERLGA